MTWPLSGMCETTRQSSPRSFRLNLKKLLSILGIVSTTWRCGTRKSSVSLTHSPHSSRRLAWHDGQKPRVLQENVNKCSAWQSGHRIRAKPERGFAQSR